MPKSLILFDLYSKFKKELKRARLGFPTWRVREAYAYFLFAYFFGWTPEEVDKQDAELLDRMLIILEENLKELAMDKMMRKGGFK